MTNTISWVLLDRVCFQIELLKHCFTICIVSIMQNNSFTDKISTLLVKNLWTIMAMMTTLIIIGTVLLMQQSIQMSYRANHSFAQQPSISHTNHTNKLSTPNRDTPQASQYGTQTLQTHTKTTQNTLHIQNINFVPSCDKKIQYLTHAGLTRGDWTQLTPANLVNLKTLIDSQPSYHGNPIKAQDLTKLIRQMNLTHTQQASTNLCTPQISLPVIYSDHKTPSY